MAIAVLVIGVVLFAIGIGGQFNVGKRFFKPAHPGDKRTARIVLTLAAIVIGAWMVIGSAVVLLHLRSHS